MLGDGQDGERSATLDPGGLVTMTWDVDQEIDPEALSGIFGEPQRTAWSGEWVGPMESLDGIWLRLTAAEPGTCRLVAGQAAVDAGLRDPVMPARYPAVVQDGSLAYLTLRRASGGVRRWELGAAGHGPRGAGLAERICDQIRAWSSGRTTHPAITAYPASTSSSDTSSSHIIDKPHTRLMVMF
jgi:protein-L-isoaspartate(D-aspartate) O-methyltransferase